MNLWIVFGTGVSGAEYVRIASAESEQEAIRIANEHSLEISFYSAWHQGEAWSA